MGKRYGSKAAYQEARMARDKDEAEYQRERTREQAETAKPMVWALVFAAAINGAGKNAQGASSIADEAVAAFDSRFINPVPVEDD